MVASGGVTMKGSGTVSAAFSLAVTTMGAGILTLPSAYADAGVVPAMVLLIGVAVLTVFTIDFLIIGVEKLGRNSHEELASALLGRRAELTVRWMLIVLNAGGAISYLVVVSDLLAPMQPHVTYYLPALTTPKHTLVAVWAVLILPLSCVPTLGALHMSSFLAIAATSLICLMVIYRFFVPGPTKPSAMTATAIANGTAKPTWWWGFNPTLALPIMVFSFCCQCLVFQIYAGLQDMRRSVMMEVSFISLIITGTIHAAVGLFGYLSNPVDVRDNIISNYDPNVDHVFRVGYVLYTVPIVMAFVITLFPLRDSIFIMWYGFSSASAATHVPRSKDYTRLAAQEEKLELLVQAEAVHNHEGKDNSVAPSPTQSSNGCSISDNSRRSTVPSSGTTADAGEGIVAGVPDKVSGAAHRNYGSVEAELHDVVEAKKHHNSVERIPLRDHLIVSIALSTGCVTVAVLAPGMVAVVALLGGVCCSTLSFITPGLYRWQLHYKRIAPCSSRCEWCLMVFMIGFGVVAGVVGTAVSIENVIVGG